MPCFEKPEDAPYGQPGAFRGEQAETDEFVEIQRLRAHNRALLSELSKKGMTIQELMLELALANEKIAMLGVYGPTGSHLSGGTP